MRIPFISVFIFTLQFFIYSASLEAKTVVTSIQPLGLLAQDIAGEAVKVDVLVPPNRSPHHYQLTVSERQRLDSADLFLWVGPELETFLSKVIRNRQQKTITASELSGMSWPEDSGSHGDHHHDVDPHLWLNPINLIVLAEHLVTALTDLSPGDEALFKQNLARVKQELQLADKNIDSQLAAHREKQFIVLHPAYNHFVERYRLKQADFIVLTPERALGAKHLFQLRQQRDAVCVFNEVGQPERLAGQIAKAVGANVAELDPLGANLSVDDKAVDVINQLAATISQCLAATE